MEQLTEYADKFLSGTKPIWGFFIAACSYILFPDQAFFTAACAVGAAILLDIITKYVALSKKAGGYWKAVRNDFEVFSSSTVTTNEFFIESDTPSKTHFICGLAVTQVPIAKFGVYVDWRIKRISTETLPPPSENPFLLALCSYVDHKNN